MDWFDIGLHALGAAGWATVVWLLSTKNFYKENGSALVVGVGGLFWVVREMLQHGGSPIASAQSILEWVVPLGVSIFVGAALFAVNEADG